VLAALEVKQAHLVAHDMGTSVATELLARRERNLCAVELASLVLSNGSVHIDLASLTLGQRLLRSPLGPAFTRVSGRAVFKLQIRRVFAKPPPDEVLDAMWDLIAREDGAALFPQIVRYLDERQRFARRWIGALERFDRPALVLWGALDPVAVLAIAETLAREIPRAEKVVLPRVGHYPQVEDPGAFAARVLAFCMRAEEG
jgi:pimeloyl-ACP methyl ester carboxylesterase